MRSRTPLVALVVAALGVLGTAVPAAATAPIIDKQPGGTDTVVSEDACPFPVREDVVMRPSMVKTFDLAGDVQLRLSGALTGTLTRLLADGSDGASLRINFSGPGVIDLATGGLTARGPWLLESPDNPSTPAFDGFLVLTQGLAEVSVDPETGVLTIDSSKGAVTDLCAALA